MGAMSPPGDLARAMAMNCPSAKFTLAGYVRRLADFFTTRIDDTLIGDLSCPDDVFCCFALMDVFSFADTMLAEWAGEHVMLSHGVCDVGFRI